MASAEYMRFWRARNRERHLQLSRESYARHRERRVQEMRDRYIANREEYLDKAAMYRAHKPNMKRRVDTNRAWWRYCQQCRQQLRALVEQFPAVADVINIDIERATDGQIRQFYDQLMEDIRNGYRYTDDRTGDSATPSRR